MAIKSRSAYPVLFDRFYSDDFVLWLGAEEMIGRTVAFSSAWQMCSNPSIRCLRWGWLPSCFFAQLWARVGRRGELHHRLGDRFRRNVFDRHSGSLAHGSGMEESHRHRGTHRGPTIAEAMSHSMMPHVDARTRGSAAPKSGVLSLGSPSFSILVLKTNELEKSLVVARCTEMCLRMHRIPRIFPIAKMRRTISERFSFP